MKRTDHYSIAMKAVIDDKDILTATKIEILETLMADFKMARYSEEREGTDGK